MALCTALPLQVQLYLNDYYAAAPSALETLASPAPGVTVTLGNRRTLIFSPDAPIAGIIFYPGGKVQYEAYAPLMEALAQRGILCVLLHMPANLAVLNINAGDGVPEQYPEVNEWYLAGHSLGGSMAAVHLSTNMDRYKGLILLASYSTKNLADSKLKVLSLYGSEDGVLGMEAYNRNLANLPADIAEQIILGGSHALFGDYGAQEGDGTPTISGEEQIRIAADAIAEFVAANKAG